MSAAKDAIKAVARFSTETVNANHPHPATETPEGTQFKGKSYWASAAGQREIGEYRQTLRISLEEQFQDIAQNVSYSVVNEAEKAGHYQSAKQLPDAMKSWAREGYSMYFIPNNGIWPVVDEQASMAWQARAHPIYEELRRLHAATAEAAAGDKRAMAGRRDDGKKAHAGFTPGALAALVGLHTDTINTHAKAAGVKTPGRGKKNHRYTLDESILILRELADSPTDKATREKCKTALADLEKDRN